MKILIVGRYHTVIAPTGQRPPIALAAERVGLQVVSSLDDAPEVLMCIDYSATHCRIIREAKKKGIRTTLVVFEPTVVLPQHSKNSVLGMFDLVLRVGRPNGTPPLRWPQSWRAVSKRPNRLQSAVMINSDKWSFVSGQLYWLRAALAAEHENVVVHGYGWERGWGIRLSHRLFELLRTLFLGALPSLKGSRYLLSRPRNYRSSVADKVSKMSEYSVALVIENSTEFLSEKLFDAWFAGCIPVYVGPDVEQMGIPEELVIQSKPDVPSMREAIDAALGVDKTTFLTALADFLGSQRAMEWENERALEQIVKAAIATNNAR